MKSATYIFTAVNLITSATAHGLWADPTPRPAGDALKTACGDQAFYMRSSDPAGNIQGEMQVAQISSTCNLWLCSGHLFADNSANVQSWTAGQVVPLQFDIRAPHTGVANVSIVDTATNTVIGSPLKSYDVFASNAVGSAPDEKSFSVTIPSDLGNKCSVAGACVLQHFWDAPDIQQTYESCIDFTVGGSGSGTGASTATSASSGAAAAASVSANRDQAVTSASAAAAAAAAAASPTSASGSGSGSTDQEKRTPEQMIDMVMSLVKRYLGVDDQGNSTSAKVKKAKAKRSHARAF